jgi:hypothetical protein
MKIELNQKIELDIGGTKVILTRFDAKKLLDLLKIELENAQPAPKWMAQSPEGTVPWTGVSPSVTYTTMNTGVHGDLAAY